MTANMTLMGLVDFVRKRDMSVIRQPVLIFYSLQDKIVKPAETLRFFERFGSPLKKTIAVEDSQDPRHHVIAGDILSPNTTERIASDILDFVKPLPNL
jgi:esterase/lipase